jgi:uncharacterized protein YfeS
MLESATAFISQQNCQLTSMTSYSQLQVIDSLVDRRKYMDITLSSLHRDRHTQLRWIMDWRAL